MTPICPCPEIMESLTTIRKELAEIRGILQPRKCSEADIASLTRLLPAIGGTFGSNPCTTKEIMSDPGIRGVLPMSNGSVGMLLSKAASDRVVIGDLQVEQLPKEHGASLWKVVRKLP